MSRSPLQKLGLFAPYGRSWAFQEYLERQPSDRAAELIVAEKEFNKTRPVTRVAEDPAESAYHDSLYGYAESPVVDGLDSSRVA